MKVESSLYRLSHDLPEGTEVEPYATVTANKHFTITDILTPERDRASSRAIRHYRY